MRKSIRKQICTLFALLIPLFIVNVSFGSMLPEGLVIEDVFQPGYGLPVGKVHLVQGEVVIMHKNQMRGYWAKKDLLLFKGDAIVTKDKGRIRFKLNDKSVITLSSNTKLVITKSVYDPAQKTRSTFINMALGKARFWAKKLADFKHSQFKVKSLTAIIGVRGSEWVQEVTEDSTRVITLEDTMLEVVSTTAPEVEPTILEDFEQTVVYVGELPTEVMMVSPEEIDKIKQDFTVTPEGEGAEIKLETKKEGVKEKEGAEEKTTEGDGAKKEVADKGTGEVIVSDQALVNPDAIEDPEVIVEAPILESIEAQEITELVETGTEQQENILEQISEPEPEPESGGQINISW